MNNFLVDTNVLIRLIIKDDESKYITIENLVKKVDNNELTLVIPTIVIAECCWLLKSFYELDKQAVASILIDILDSENVKAEEGIEILALQLYAEKNVDFADALISIKSSRDIPVITWDKRDFKKLDCEFYSPNELLDTL